MRYINIIRKYMYNLLLSLDQLLNTILGGDPDETCSSRVGKYYKGSIFHKVINKIFFWQKDHCVESIDKTEGNDAVFM
jgi:cyclophilin family peptidyl-prolyl cis-trans isomerase